MDKQLCFRCLTNSYQGRNCKRTKKCGLNGWKRNHNRFLRKSERRVASIQAWKRRVRQMGKRPYQATSKNRWACQHYDTCLSLTGRFCFSATGLPDWISTNGKRIQVNAALDDASSVSYVHEKRGEDTPWKNSSLVCTMESVIKLPHLGSMIVVRYQITMRCPSAASINTEKPLTTQPWLGEHYQNVTASYLEKGYIHKVPQAEKEPQCQLYLPHFPAYHLERATLKTRMVFDASAKFWNTSLNDEILPGPRP